MADIRLGPFTVGIDHVSPDTNLSHSAARDAVNVDFDQEGNIAVRPGLHLVHASDRAALVWTSREGYAYVQDGPTIHRASFAGATLVLDPVATLDSDDRASFCDLLGQVACVNRTNALLLNPFGATKNLAIETPGPFSYYVNAYGGLDAGAYAVGISYLRGEQEGALSPLAFIPAVPEGGGFQLSLPQPTDPDITGINIYVTQANGDVPYWRCRAPLGMSGYVIGRMNPGKLADTMNLSPMPPGNIVRYWRGRLLVARGNCVFISEPLNYALNDPRHGFIQEPRRVTLLEPVEGGVFVGTNAGVVFYRGASPKEWSRTVTDGKPPIAFSGCSVPANELGGDVGGGGTYVAMWLAENGFVMGTSDGALQQPQARRIRLTAGNGALCVHQRKAVAVTF
jgi:hypothetical protein